MEITCPHCGHAESEGFESIEVNELQDDFVCANCRRSFVACIKNCIRCDFEQARTWRVDAAPSCVGALPCAQCDQVEGPADALDEL